MSTRGLKVRPARVRSPPCVPAGNLCSGCSAWTCCFGCSAWTCWPVALCVFLAIEDSCSSGSVRMRSRGCALAYRAQDAAGTVSKYRLPTLPEPCRDQLETAGQTSERSCPFPALGDGRHRGHPLGPGAPLEVSRYRGEL